MKLRMRLASLSRIDRAFIVVFILCAVSTSWYFFQTIKLIQPSEWYYFTTDGSDFDTNSPNQKKIIDFEIWSIAANNSHSSRCNFGLLASKGISPLGTEYRDISLCNSAGISEQEYKIADQFFRKKVDELYGNYYSNYAELASLSFFYGLFAGLILFLCFLVLKWVLRGSHVS